MKWAKLIELLVLLSAWIVCADVAASQAIPLKKPEAIRVCPGAFPTDLTALDCRYNMSIRTQDYLSGYVTDQALLDAAIFGLGAQIIQRPSDWKRTWAGYGDRVGARYTQGVGKGTAQYLLGSLLKDDPRFVAYRNDPAIIGRRRDAICGAFAGRPGTAGPGATDGSSCLKGTRGDSVSSLSHDGWQRFGHAWYDVVTVRHSQIDGNGRRMPAYSRFAGEFAGAYAGYPWYRGNDNAFAQVGERAAGAFGAAVLSSFYTEYKPEITNLVGAIFRHGNRR